MIGYATLGSNDIDRALDFYDALTAVMGAKRVLTMPDDRRFTLYGVGRDRPMLAITRPYDGGTASAGNGNMLALQADSHDQVHAVHAKALELGGTDEGAPGPRGPAAMHIYGGYFRDPDGNKIFIHKIG